MQTNPLEQFIREEVEVRGGLWEQVEPQVYDILLPREPHGAGGGAPPEVIRAALDPDAIAEHPGCRFAGFGTPLLDELLEAARRRAPFARAWLVGLNPRLDDAAAPLRRLDLEPSARLAVRRVRPMEFAVGVHWFRATYVSDEKEQETLAVAIDAQNGHQVRHLDRLLDWPRLQDAPVEALAEAQRMPPAEVYRLARDRVVRTVSAAANTRRRELDALHARKRSRMESYYDALAAEIDEQVARARKRDEDPQRGLARRATVHRERERRLAELRRKSALRVELTLANLLEVRQPKLVIEAALSSREAPAGARRAPAGKSGSAVTPTGGAAIEFVWDPLTASLEPPACPRCALATYALRSGPDGWSCPSCKQAGLGRRRQPGHQAQQSHERGGAGGS